MKIKPINWTKIWREDKKLQKDFPNGEEGARILKWKLRLNIEKQLPPNFPIRWELMWNYELSYTTALYRTNKKNIYRLQKAFLRKQIEKEILLQLNAKSYIEKG